jgi:hypothetical protein
MKIRDLSEWQLQCAEFAADPDPISSRFLTFIQTWAAHAESMQDAWEAEERGDGPLSPIEALRRTLHPAEERTEHWTIGFIGQALLLLCHHWAPITDGEEFVASMTSIEQNLFADAAMIWQIKQQMKAQEVSADEQ